LLYLRATYGPTFRFYDGLPIEDFLFSSRNVSGLVSTLSGQVTARNFKYHNRETNIHKCDFWDILDLSDLGKEGKEEGNPEGKSKKQSWAKKIHWTDLTVTLPADSCHEFWKLGSRSYTWDPKRQPDTCKFTVTKCGGTRTDANWRATRLAMEFIQCVRDRTVPIFPSRPSVQSCRVLEIGRQLHNLFLAHPNSFADLSADDGLWKRAEGDLKRMTEEHDLEIGLLLNYYRVQHFFPLLFYILPTVLPFANARYSHYCG